MKKTVVLACLILGIALSTNVNGMPQNRIVLSEYTYTCDGREVGKLVLRRQNEDKIKFKLEGPSARYFQLEQGNRLIIRKKHCDNTQPWHDLVISAKTQTGTIRDTLRVVKNTFLQNKVVAHRGAWKHTGETENSLGALQAAIRMGCAFSELDVNLSADGLLFINHDAVIQNVKIDTAQSVLLFTLKLSNGEHLPTLESFICETMRQSKTKLLIEVKPFSISKARALEAAQETVKLVHKLRAQAWVSYISFSQDILNEIRELDPYADVCYLNGDVTPKQVKHLGYNGIDYYYDVFHKNPEWISGAQEFALSTNTWVVDKEDDMLFFLKKGFDWITTDEPELLFRVIDNFNKR